MDSQVTELLGRNQLISELLRAGLEVALPLRDRGIDLIAYADLGSDVRRFVACPIQMKAATSSSFSVETKYAKFPGLILAYIWHISDPNKIVTHALTYQEACAIAVQMGWTKTLSWTEKGSYTITRAEQNKKLAGLLEAHRMTPEKWREKVTGVSNDSVPFVVDRGVTSGVLPSDQNDGSGTALATSVPVKVADGVI